jgi:hypothetical protein
VLDGGRWPTARPAAVSPGRRPGNKASLDGCGKPCPHRDSIPVPSNRYRVAVPTALSRLWLSAWRYTSAPYRSMFSCRRAYLSTWALYFYCTSYPKRKFWRNKLRQRERKSIQTSTVTVLNSSLDTDKKTCVFVEPWAWRTNHPVVLVLFVVTSCLPCRYDCLLERGGYTDFGAKVDYWQAYINVERV